MLLSNAFIIKNERQKVLFKLQIGAPDYTIITMVIKIVTRRPVSSEVSAAVWGRMLNSPAESLSALLTMWQQLFHSLKVAMIVYFKWQLEHFLTRFHLDSFIFILYDEFKHFSKLSFQENRSHQYVCVDRDL